MNTPHKSSEKIVPIKPRQRLRRWLVISLALITCLIAAVGTDLWWVAQVEGVSAMRDASNALLSYAVILRLAIYGGLVGCWPTIVDRVLQGSESDDIDVQRQELLQMRKRIVLWILVFELLIVQRLPILLLQELS